MAFLVVGVGALRVVMMVVVVVMMMAFRVAAVGWAVMVCVSQLQDYWECDFEAIVERFGWMGAGR